jgi:hypothetical protein
LFGKAWWASPLLARLLRDYRLSIANSRPLSRVDFQPNEVAAPELAVNGQIEHRTLRPSGWILTQIVQTSREGCVGLPGQRLLTRLIALAKKASAAIADEQRRTP